MADPRSNHKAEEHESIAKSQNILKKSNPTLSNCHSCNHHFPPASKSNTLNLKPLKSQWRVALLCDPCHRLIQSKSLCSYCFSGFPNDAKQEVFLDCVQCVCRVHLNCVPAQNRVVHPLALDRRLFVCFDCRALPSSEDRRIRELFRVAELRRAEAGRANEIAIQKMKVAMIAVNKAKEALIDFSGVGAFGKNKKLDLKLHSIVNGSKRVLKIDRINRSSKTAKRVGSYVKTNEMLGSFITCDGSKMKVNDIIGSSKDVNHIEENHTSGEWMSHKKAIRTKRNLSEICIGENSSQGKGINNDQNTNKYSKKEMSLKELSNGRNC